MLYFSACSKQLLWHQESHLNYMSQVIHKADYMPTSLFPPCIVTLPVLPNPNTVGLGSLKKTKPNIRHCQLACELSPQSESCSPIASPHDLFHNSTVSHWPSVWGPGLLPTWDREGPATQLPWRSKSPFLWDLNLHSKAGITIDVNCITWMQAGLF